MEIKGKVHYVGVNDRNKALFENLWPLPYGVSYNSYLIDDEMVALVDTVDVCYFEVYLKKIRSIIGDKPINYLIINHMEPDHSGSISLIKQYYPNIVIVGNKKTFEMIEGYYGVGGARRILRHPYPHPGSQRGRKHFARPKKPLVLYGADGSLARNDGYF